MRLKLRTKNRAQSEKELAFQIAIYADDLAEYPQDVVVGALRYWAKNEKWWPAWAELKALLDARVNRRLALIEALRRVPREPPLEIDNAARSNVAETDPDIWFREIMVPYIRRRLPDRQAAALITAWQVGDSDAIVTVDALNRERKLREMGETAGVSAATDPLTVRCPRCGAPRGQRCRAMLPLSYHALRRVQAHNSGSDARAAEEAARRPADAQAVTSGAAGNAPRCLPQSPRETA